MDTFTNRVAVITGGGSGIGRAMAIAFAREGAKIVIADLDETGMADTLQHISQQGGHGISIKTDVSNLKEVETLAARAQETFGAIHIVCNNAGVGVWGDLQSATYQDWQWVMGVNLWGVIHGVQAFTPGMIAHGEGGHIVNTASMAGLIASSGLGVYNTTKYAVVGLSETLAKDLRPHHIGVSVLCPMGVNTQINDSARNRPQTLVNASADTEIDPLALVGRTLDPTEVAEQVVQAIRTNELYIITHEESLEHIQRRFKRIERSILHRQEDKHNAT